MTEPVPDLTRQEKATRLLAIAVVTARLELEGKRLRGELVKEMATGARQEGVVDPKDMEGTTLGFVTKKKGSTYVKVTDEAKVLAWVKEHLPTEVQVVESVRPAFLTRLKDAVKADGGWVDPDTSEVMDVPGMEVTTGDPGLMVKASEEADRLVMDALAARRLELMGGVE